MRILAAILIVASTPVWAEPLRIGTESDFQPYVFMDDDNTRRGFDVDFMEKLCAAGRFECEWVEVPFADLFTRLAAGDYDVAIGGILTTPERDILTDWTDAYRVYEEEGLATFAGLNMEIDPETARIAVQGGTVHEGLLNEHGLYAIPYPSNSDALNALFNGDADMFFSSSGYVDDLEKRGETRLVNLGSITYDNGGPLIAVSKSKPDLRAKLDDIIDALQADGTIALLGAKWFPQTPQDDS